MDETKVQIGDDILLDIGTHSDWYISVICYNNESVNVELRRKTDRNNKWWVAEQTENSSEKPNNWEDFFREPTAEERKAVADYIDSISVPTGVNVFDLMDEPQKSCSTCGYSTQSPSCDSCEGYSNWWSLEDEPQTCDTCKYGEDKHRYAHICNECGVGINNYKPKDEPQTEDEILREQCRAFMGIVEQTKREGE